MAIASNEFFSGWTKASIEPRLYAGSVDRRAFNGTIMKPVPSPTA